MSAETCISHGTPEYARRVAAMRFKQYPSGHAGQPAISFFNYCAACWDTPSPGGDRSTPRQRAMRGVS